MSTKNILTPIILEGPGRSGSTLLMQILSSREEIAFDRTYPYENRLLTYIYYFCASLFPNDNENEIKLALEADIYDKQISPPFNISSETRRLTKDELFLHTWKAMNDYFQPEAKFYAEKSRLGFSKKLRQSGLRDTKLIYRVRDPRDIWVSINKFDEKRGYFGFGRKNKQPLSDYLKKFISDQKIYLGTALKIINSNSTNSIVVKYEDLISNYRKTIDCISNFLEVSLSKEFPSDNFSRHATSPSPEASLKKWVNHINNKTNDIFLDNLGNLLEKLGYDVTSKPKSNKLFFFGP